MTVLASRSVLHKLLWTEIEDALGWNPNPRGLRLLCSFKFLSKAPRGHNPIRLHTSVILYVCVQFMTEMRETAYLLTNLTPRWIHTCYQHGVSLFHPLETVGRGPVGGHLKTKIYWTSGLKTLWWHCRSLVVVDELGRATSTCDGLAIAWSCCEYLLSFRT